MRTACGQTGELQARSIVNLDTQCAFACWDAAISPKKKPEEARTTGEVNGLSPSRRDAPVELPCMPATHPVPPDLTLFTHFNTYFNLHLSWSPSPLKEARAAISSMLLMQLHLALTARHCTLARRDPGQRRGGRWAETHRCHHGAVLSGYMCHQLFPACADVPDPTDHPLSSASVSHGELNGVRWLRTISSIPREPAPRCPAEHSKPHGKKSVSLSQLHSPY